MSNITTEIKQVGIKPVIDRAALTSAKRIVNGLRAFFKPLNAEVKDVIANINRHASAVDKTAVVAEMKEADISRTRECIISYQ